MCLKCQGSADNIKACCKTSSLNLHSTLSTPPQEYLLALQKLKSQNQHCSIVLTTGLLDTISDLPMIHFHGIQKLKARWRSLTTSLYYSLLVNKLRSEIFFKVVLQYPFSKSLDIEKQLQWKQDWTPNSNTQSPAASVKRQLRQQQSGKSFLILYRNPLIKFLKSVITMAPSEITAFLVGQFLEFWKLFMAT